MDQDASIHQNLRDRLKRLGVTRGMPATTGPATSPASTQTGTPVETLLPGTIEETPLGACFVTETEHPLDAYHGNTPLAAIFQHDQEVLVSIARDTSLQTLDLASAAFIDTETSGLAGGTGTYAFLIGVGFFDGNVFRVRQYFMRNPGEEPAMIHLLDEWLPNFKAVVSFNGKAFDLPLLDTRFIRWRRPFPLKGVPHLDLLAPARRLWKERLPSCSLTSLEEHILGLFREDDVPGWLIPSLYFEYAQTGDAQPLRPVFSHNTLDILSMVALTARMAACFAAPEAAGVINGADWYSLGRCYETVGWTEKAETAYQRALKAPCAPTIRERVFENLSFLYKRRAAWDQATRIWQDLIQAGLSTRLYPYEELAKYYEHQKRDYTSAMRLVQQAIERIERGELRPRRPARRALDELWHRLARLERKQNLSSTPPDKN